MEHRMHYCIIIYRKSIISRNKSNLIVIKNILSYWNTHKIINKNAKFRIIFCYDFIFAENKIKKTKFNYEKCTLRSNRFSYQMFII